MTKHTAWNPTATFAQVFGTGSSEKIGNLVSGTSAESHWLTALLNSQNTSVTKFPHTQQDVLLHYSGDPVRKAKAIEFYSTYVNIYTTL